MVVRVMVVRHMAADVMAHRGMGRTALPAFHALFQQRKHLRFKAQVVPERKADLRVLLAQVLQLALDALDQRAGVQVVGQDHDLCHAQQHLALHHALQARVGDAGKGDIHQFVLGLLPQPARQLGHLAVRLAVAGAAAEQDHAGAARIRHIQPLQALAQLALQHRQRRLAGTQVGRDIELHLRMTQACLFNRPGNIALDMAGGVENQRQYQQLAVAGLG